MKSLCKKQPNLFKNTSVEKWCMEKNRPNYLINQVIRSVKG